MQRAPGRRNILSGAPARTRRAGVLLQEAALPRSFTISRNAPSLRLALALLSFGLLGCGAPPLVDIEVARDAMERAAAAEGVARAPGLCAAAQSILVRAEAETRAQSRRSALRRDYDEASRLALEARLAAETCAFQAGAARARTRQRARNAIEELSSALPRASSLSRHVGDPDIADELRQAGIALGEAKVGFERGQFERAEEAAERGRAGLSRSVSAINRLFDSYATSPRRADWKRWVKETLRVSRSTGEPVILVDKLRRELLVYRGRDELATYEVDLGIGGMNIKVRAGDDATPEGRYRITEVRGPGQTRYYRALMLDYPNAEDLERFRKMRRSGHVGRRDDVGGLIEIHGHGGRKQDWTKGCVALDDDHMDDLVPRVRVGTRVTIVGTIPEEVLP